MNAIKKTIDKEVIDFEAKSLAKRFESIPSRAAFAKQHGINPTMIQQHLTSVRPISLDYAKKYASAFKCKLIDISARLHNEIKDTNDFIDQAFYDELDGSGRITAYDFNNLNSHSNVTKKAHSGITLEQYDAVGAMGDGLILKDQSGVIGEWNVSEEWVRLNLKNYTKISNVKIVTGFGDSMQGTFNSGDPILIDIGVKTVDYDSAYFFRVGNEGYIKRLQRVPGIGLRAISANKEYEPWSITKDMDFEVFGVVLKTFNSVNFQ